MKSGRKRRTNYSPVRQMSSGRRGEQPVDEESPSPVQLRGSVSKINSNPSHLHHLNYIDEESPPITLEEYERQYQSQLADQDSNSNQEDQAEEVYLYSCCGVTKELDPSIKYMSTFRSLFFFFNFLVFLCGLGNLAMGLWFRIDPKVYEIHKYIETQNFTIAGWIMLFCGFVTCLLSLIGFGAASKQSAGSLVFYFITLIMSTLAFVGTLVLLTVYGLGFPLERFLTKEIYEQMRRRSMNSDYDGFMSNDAVQFMDFIQVKMRCCGATDFQDYAKLGLVVPTTCYTFDENFVNAPGCGRAIRRLFDIRAGLATGFSAASVVVQLMAIILAALMFCSIYHSRANPRPVSPAVQANLSARNTPTNLYQHGPRSRTPIVI